MLQCGVDLRQIIHWQLTAGVPVSTAPPPQQCRTTECCSVLRAQSCNTLICASLDSEHCCSLSAVQCSEHNPQVVLSCNTLICASLDCCSVWPGVMLNIYNTFQMFHNSITTPDSLAHLKKKRTVFAVFAVQHAQWIGVELATINNNSSAHSPHQ